MKDIKFRAWDGKKIHQWDSTEHGAVDQVTGTPYPKLFYLPMSWLVGDSNDWAWMQYTGLTDKNRKEIYEGDILRNMDDSDMYLVRYDAPTFVLQELDQQADFLYMYDASDLEVVGNMYENSELLEIKK